ncbi:MAG: outer membrane protein transport protein [Verrucomicrobia bacterium]|nr:outer membrane protein transport protein [Verrucomicrobiota bacterium]
MSFNPVIAWRAHPKLSIAAGPTFNYADTDLRQTIYSQAIFPPGGRLRFKGDGTDFGFNAGVLWKPTEKHAFGVSYRSETAINFKGTSSTSGADTAPFPFTIPSGSQPASARFQFPQHVVAGWSFRPTEKWNIEFDADWTDWDHLNVVTLQQPSGNTALPFNWRSSWFYELGATRYFGKDWRVSAGYIYSENSVPSANFNPVVPDSNRHIFSLGVGGQWRRVSWDFAYQFAYGPERTVSGNTLVFPVGAVADGRYTFFSHAITAAVSCRF